MKRDFVPAIAFTVLLHSAILWYARGHPRLAPAAKADSDAPIQIFPLPQLPPPEPEEVEDQNPPPENNQPAPPTLQEVVTMAPPEAMVQPVQPTPIDTTADKNLRIIPIDGTIGHSGIGTIFDPSQLSQEPVATVREKPNYPYDLKRAGISGKVIVDFIVDSQGYVVRPYAVSSDHPELGRAAVEGVRRWRFKPGMKDGRAVNTHMQVPILFSINND